MSRPFCFDRQQLQQLAAARHDEYAAAQPFPHVVVDDFLPEWVLDEVLTEFPSPREDAWWRFDSDNERKLATRDDSRMGDATRQLLAECNSAAFVDFLEELTGIRGLVPDPHLEGGGLHQIVRGGHLGVHVDFNRHPRTGLDRRLNALVYLNRDWREEYGGALELWGRDQTRCEKRILPLFNRLVVFSTTEHSFHGHPEPLTCPEDRTRKSLALYYYSNGRPEEGGASATTHNTIWKAEPGNGARGRGRVKAVVRLLTPPVLLDAARAARRRARA
jgi:Rps23 Pro-64 3,4-dihydroxylase Tpa1-like proline 4-hydroxylase